MERRGVEVVGVLESAGDLISMASATRPDHIVVDLALSGELGLGIVGALRDAAPKCAVVVLCPFDSLRQPALRAGASELFDFTDLRKLDRCLQQQGAHEPGCDCCSSPGSEVGSGGQHGSAHVTIQESPWAEHYRSSSGSPDG
jgi:ActR/RegA family two-component response regulator